MGRKGRRKSVHVPVEQFVEEVRKFEDSYDGGAGLTKFWNAFASTEWARSLREKPLSGAFFANKAKELGIEISVQTARHFTGKIERKKFVPNANYSHMFKVFPKRFHAKVRKAKKGSLRGAIDAKCLECSSFDTREVKECPCRNCPLWDFRPYK